MWDRWVKNEKIYTQPISHEQFLKYKEQDLDVSLTIGKPVPTNWFERLPGNKILGLACGGGQQGPILAAHGYEVTVMDFNEKQLEGDRAVAKREGLEIKTVRSDMSED